MTRSGFLRLGLVFLAICSPVRAQDAGPLQPDLLLGGPTAEGLAAFEFIAGLAVDQGGTIYVLEGRAAEIRVFDQNGEASHRIGQRGQGPGEFQAPGALFLDGDTLVVVDNGLPRVTWFTVDGELARTLPVEISALRHGHPVRGLGRVGPWLVFETQTGCLIGRFDGASSTVFADSNVDRRQRVIAIHESAGQVSLLENVVHADVLPLYRDRACTVIAAPFPRVTRFGLTASGRLVTLDDGQPFLSMRTIDGPADAEPIMRDARKLELAGDFSPRPVQAPDIDAYEAAVLNPPTVTLLESDREWRREALEEIDIPREIAALDDLIVATDGTIWVRRGSSPVDPNADWVQVGQDGSSARAISLPSEVRVKVITRDAIYGVILDDLGVQYVARFPIR